MGRRASRNKDREVLLSFLYLSIKSAVLDALWDQPRLEVEGQQLFLYSDLCPLTLKRHREWKFLTSKLTWFGLPYKWSYPFKLLTDYKGKTVVLTTIQQAKTFEEALAGEEVEVEVLNQGPHQAEDSFREKFSCV